MSQYDEYNGSAAMPYRQQNQKKPYNYTPSTAVTVMNLQKEVRDFKRQVLRNTIHCAGCSCGKKHHGHVASSRQPHHSQRNNTNRRRYHRSRSPRRDGIMKNNKGTRHRSRTSPPSRAHGRDVTIKNKKGTHYRRSRTPTPSHTQSPSRKQVIEPEDPDGIYSASDSDAGDDAWFVDTKGNANDLQQIIEGVDHKHDSLYSFLEKKSNILQEEEQCQDEKKNQAEVKGAVTEEEEEDEN